MKTLFLDIGGIFFYPAWRLEGIAYTSNMLGVPKEKFSTALKQYKTQFYTGKISERSYWQKTLKAVGRSPRRAAELERTYRKFVRPIPETLSLLPHLSSKYHLISCNNSPKEWMDYRIESASLNKFFDRFVTSGYVGSMKPEKSFFAKAFEETSIEDGALYLDDDKKYIALAKKMYGIQGRVYETPEDLLFWVRQNRRKGRSTRVSLNR